ncbi:alpha/beta hydrolase [Bacillus capparidis]|nr:alpha/beta hydrolase family protein [Bacillus capparidis]MED1094508.1 alpha/beta hydrolase family protein [Bacillus capparidis]
MRDTKLIFSKIIDRCALHHLHKTRSEKFQYSPLSNWIPETMDRESFYNAYTTEISLNMDEVENDYAIGKFTFESLVPSGDSANDHIEDELYITNNEFAPNIIFVHGWRMDSLDRIKKIFHSEMRDMRWNMYYFTLPYHFQRKPGQSLYSGEYMISADIYRTVQSIKQSVVDLRALIQWIKANKKGPVILIGVSLGGFITNLTATLETEIDALVSIFYANRLSYSIWNTIPGKYIREDLEHHGINYNDLIRYWRITEPSQAIPKIRKEKILLISAKHDQYVHLEDANHLWESWDRPARYIYNCGHAGIVLKRKKIASDTISFLQKNIGKDIE